MTDTNRVFKLDTPNTTYLFCIDKNGKTQNLFYGAKIADETDFSFLQEPFGTGLGTSVVYEANGQKTILNNVCAEESGVGKGDFREPLLIVRDKLNSAVVDFTFESAAEEEGFAPPELPSAFGKKKTLHLTMSDKARKLKLHLFYSMFDDCDTIVKSVALENCSEDVYTIERLFSSQLDLPDCDFVLDTLDGAWAKERYINSRELSQGVFRVDSKCGISSNTHNPYVCLRRKNASFDNGDCYGVNLIYSGNHAEIVETTVFSKTHVLNGINDFAFSWTLDSGKTFYSPEATVCFSDKGTNGLTQQNHLFVNKHIVPTFWQNKPRYVLANNWEATMFNFTEKKLLAIAKAAKDVGAELFVLDDGWFGKRTNDTRGLGDWTVNKSRLPDGLDGLQKKLDALGLKFGLWVEPEMVNPDSDLYRAHPDWAVVHPDYAPSLSRNQLLLDLCRDDVCAYLIDAMTKVFSSAEISYVKWDFNRPFSDFYTSTTKNQGEFFHRYMLGFYKVVRTLTEKFPEILFESCASGGNRVDLGILRYMPQFWASDNTDSFDRVKIQEGTLTAYPQSAMGSHVSAVPNMQTLRTSFIDDRFNTAALGLLGYELDLTELSAVDKTAVKEQIKWYKTYRKTLQFGQYFRTRSVFDGRGGWCIVNADKTQAVACISNTVAETIPRTDVLKTKGLSPDTHYRIETRQQQFNVKTFGNLINMVLPVKIKQDGKIAQAIDNNFALKSEKQSYVLSGQTLNNAGIKLCQQFSSSGYDMKETRIMQDFGSRLYSIDAEQEK